MSQPVVVSVNISEQKGTRKHPLQGPVTITTLGMQGDAHAGDWHRQLSLLAQESIDKMQGHGLVLKPGDFAENITTQNLNLLTLPIGTRIQIDSPSKPATSSPSLRQEAPHESSSSDHQ
jgi:MOSC domain-containing protein YiiM